MNQKHDDQSKHDNQNDADQLCAFFRRSRYDIVQARTVSGWGAIHSFVPCDVRAAKRAAQMLERMGREHIQIRHAKRARLRVQPVPAIRDVVVVTYYPERTQTVFSLETAERLRLKIYLEDEVSRALSVEIDLIRHISPER